MGIYTDLDKGFPANKDKIPEITMPHQGEATSNSSFGCQVINSYKARVESFDHLFRLFTEAAQNRFVWQRTKFKPGELLDNTSNSVTGDCDQLAKMLVLLAQLPTPYGAGLAGKFDIATYRGKHNLGFISNHEREILRLKANTRLIKSKQPTCYLWENHKVVSHNGNFYDPCYNKIYQRLEEMAVYEITKEEGKYCIATHCEMRTSHYFKANITPTLEYEETLSKTSCLIQ
ncbi:TPA: hypothetical protein NQK13_000833 [Pseudomonas aeruginosa]|nr:hypothetical protein [Pseudomonas aeruginosa]HCJ0901031.1 hypothetical protein [Pseudomonas aeruginosa]HCJ1437346.1 hypothetical protein [Pseudomonas aeruginosa]HCJ1449482.1 hypothetical protein [Pseudomonas aeruginosa]HCJ4896471.1 hypothetical protein [Pseudomonas aeruginosa]